MEEETYNHLNKLLDEENFEEARTTVLALIKAVKKNKDTTSILLKLELYGFLIDIGFLTSNENDLKVAITFLKNNKSIILPLMTESSYNYNIGNAKSGLVRIFQMKKIGIHNPYVTKENLHETIKYYWQAFKSRNPGDQDLIIKIMINLANALMDIGRFVEALQFLDLVLHQDPGNPHALVSRGDCIYNISELTNCNVSTSLFVQIFKSYNEGIKTGLLPKTQYDRVTEANKEVLSKITQEGFNTEQINKEIKESQAEYINHTTYRKYCIDNFLTLNEHSLYCNCKTTQHDNLQIGVQNALFKGQNIPKLELLLNRIKSEFAFARWTYFQSLQTNSIEFDVKYSELLEGEIITPQSELQRTSYRICYGILDKMALGICKIYNIQLDEYYFETFWYDPKSRPIFEKQKNFHLNALLSIASDLIADGELSQFKKWRNIMEHNLLVLKDTKSKAPDVLNVFEDEKYVEIVDATDFRYKTLHLLQLTRAAIFSFVYCIRLETIQHYDESKKGFTITFKE